MKSNRSKVFHVKLSESEYATLYSYYKQSGCQTLCGYTRKVVLKQPVTFLYRNQSLDECFEELVGLRTELKKVELKLDLALDKLLDGSQNSLDYEILRSAVNEELKPSIANVMKHITQFSDVWYQNLEVQKV